jgi:hypothetical protein
MRLDIGWLRSEKGLETVAQQNYYGRLAFASLRRRLMPACVFYRLYLLCVCLVIFIAALQKKTQFPMDLFYFDKSYAVLACLPCGYAVVPGTVASHLRAHHKDELQKSNSRRYVD